MSASDSLPLSVRHSPRSRPPHGPAVPPPAAVPVSDAGGFAHPASVALQSPLGAPVSAMGLMQSMSRRGSHTQQPIPPPPPPPPAAIGTPVTRSRRGSVSAAAAGAGAMADSTETKHEQPPSAVLRSSSTSPIIGSRARVPPGSGSRGGASAAAYPPSPSYPSFGVGSSSDPFDTPSLGGLGGGMGLHTPGMGSMGMGTMGGRSRYTHGLSKPFESGVSPFMAPLRRSPRISHSPSPSAYHSFMSPSPSMGGLSHSHSPNLSFALPSPSLLPSTGGMGMGLSGSTPSSSTRDLNGSMHQSSSAASHQPMLNSHIFGLSWEGEHITRRSPRLSSQSSYSRGSPSFALFSPPVGAQQHQPHAPMADVQMQSSAQGSASRTRATDSSPPSMSPPLVPSSPNMSMLGKLRSMHADGGGEPGSHVKLEGEEPQHAHQQQAQTSGAKRGRSEFDNPGFASPVVHSVPPAAGTYGGLPLTSPAMVGALPPSSQPMSMNDAQGSDALYDPQQQQQQQQQQQPAEQVTPSRRIIKSSIEKRERLDAAGSAPRRPRVPKALHTSESESYSSPDLSGSSVVPSPPSAPAIPGAGNGSGQSCHQCKSRRLVSELVFCCNLHRKGRDKRVAPSATSSASHSCRKKYCGVCLTKFYNESPPSKQAASSWPCPACRGICCCAACRRIKAKQLGDLDPTTLSPTSVLAYSYVYCPDLLLSAMGDDAHADTDGSAATHVSAATHTAAAAAASADAQMHHQHQHYQQQHASAPSGGKYYGGGKGKRRAEHHDHHHEENEDEEDEDEEEEEPHAHQ